MGRITAVSMTVNGSVIDLTNSLTYRADGLLIGQTFGNGIAETRDYDLQGRLETQTIGTVDTRIYTYDANGNVTAFTGNAASASYGYDALDRLTQDTASISSSSFTYDANGNRLTRIQDGKTLTYTYEANTNRLDQVDTETAPKDVVLDAAGNTLADRNTKRTFTYNNAGRLHQFFKKGPLKATYIYNAQGQRTRKVKVNNKGKIRTFVYHYDLLGNLIAETREDGALIRAYVWVDNRPLAQIKHKRNTGEDILSYLHTDHLNTPRIATNDTQTVVWRWESRAFGNFKIDKDPDGDGTNVNVRLRFPGQFKDGESGLYYNWNRYYDPGKGRYVTSDPIGLVGGLSTYVYVGANPLYWIDPLGLKITGSWKQEPALSNVKVQPICDAAGNCATRPAFPPPLKWGLPPKYLAAIAPFRAEGLISWEIECTDDEKCQMRRWILTGGEQLSTKINVKVWVPIISHPAITIYNIGTFAAEATRLARQYFEPFVAIYKQAIDPTTWCLTMPQGGN